MELLDLRSATRAMLDDSEEPHLWPDEDIDRRLNNAVREACLRARLLRSDAESDPDVCSVPVTAGQSRIELDPSIMAVRSASLADGANTLRIVASTDMDRFEPGWDAGRLESGMPFYLVVDMGPNAARLWPTPDADATLRLRVWRMPTDLELMEGDSDEPVITLPDPEELCHWAAYECYMVTDSQTYDADAAGTHLQLFEARFGKRPNLHEMSRWADAPSPRARHTQYF
ncbi:MAG: hypothetical protein L0H83_11455 [Salinisphaera sp.]|nr:hypothetical protein [Salinisphaera sp.]